MIGDPTMNWQELKRRRLEHYRGRRDLPSYHRHQRRPWKPWYIWIFTNNWAISNIIILLILLGGLLGWILELFDYPPR